MIVVGRFFYKEAMSTFQWVAALLAALGIGYDIFQYGTISWVTLFVCLGHPPYFLMRRKLAVPPITGLLSDLILLTPIVLIMLYVSDGISLVTQNSKLWFLLPLLGAFSAIAMSLMMVASRKLPISLFGALSYVEPMLLFVFSITILNQSLDEGGSLFMYSMITLGLLIMLTDSARSYINNKRNERLQSCNELQISSFPLHRLLKKRRVKGVSAARRFRITERYRHNINKRSLKID